MEARKAGTCKSGMGLKVYLGAVEYTYQEATALDISTSVMNNAMAKAMYLLHL